MRQFDMSEHVDHRHAGHHTTQHDRKAVVAETCRWGPQRAL